jgi:6-phosphogluconolactonase (cycloisomerase 2 family)
LTACSMFIVLASCAGMSSVGAPTAQYDGTNAPSERDRTMPETSCTSASCVYVADSAPSHRGVFGTVWAYRADANGDVRPAYSIRHKLDIPTAVALDTAGDVYVTNIYHLGGLPAVKIFAPGKAGRRMLVGKIAGVRTLLAGPTGITVDLSGNVYVSNTIERGGAGRVTVYAAGKHNDVSPIQDIEGPNTGLLSPTDVARDSEANIYVTNTYQNQTITVYPPNASGDVAPIRTIGGSNTLIADARALALDAADNIYVANCDVTGYRVNVYAAGADGNVAPIRVIGGPNTGLKCPSGIALDRAGNIFVSNYASATITVYGADADGNVLPKRIIGGPKTGLSSPGGIAVH